MIKVNAVQGFMGSRGLSQRILGSTHEAGAVLVLVVAAGQLGGDLDVEINITPLSWKSYFLVRCRFVVYLCRQGAALCSPEGSGCVCCFLLPRPVPHLKPWSSQEEEMARAMELLLPSGLCPQSENNPLISQGAADDGVTW